MVTSVPYMYRNYGTCTIGTVHNYVTNYGREYTINIPQIRYKTVAIPAQFQLGAFII